MVTSWLIGRRYAKLLCAGVVCLGLLNHFEIACAAADGNVGKNKQVRRTQATGSIAVALDQEPPTEAPAIETMVPKQTMTPITEGTSTADINATINAKLFIPSNAVSNATIDPADPLTDEVVAGELTFTLSETPTKAPIGVPVARVGDNGAPADVFPLQLCQGDCDTDADCSENLICWQRENNDDIPGCLGTLEDGTDICVSADYAPSTSPSVSPTLNPSQSPSLRPTPFPTTGTPTNSPTTASPTYSPKIAARIGDNGDSNFPLQNCEGDCDADADCEQELICWQRNENEVIPGCFGSLTDSTDICIDPKRQPTPAPSRSPTPFPTFAPGTVPGGRFKLKMYWEPGYFWQEEDFERKWCVAHSYPRSFCWYGETEGDCYQDQMYIDNCDSSRYEMWFEFVNVGNGEALIKVDGQDKCWTREGRRIYLEICQMDGSYIRQRWFPQNGSFASYRFQIVQKDQKNKCATNAHHPKSREVLEMHDCDSPEAKTTSYWNRYG